MPHRRIVQVLNYPLLRRNFQTWLTSRSHALNGFVLFENLPRISKDINLNQKCISETGSRVIFLTTLLHGLLFWKQFS